MGLVALLLLFAVPKIVATVVSVVMMPIHSAQNWLAYSSDSFPQYFRDRTTLLTELNNFKYSQSSASGDRLTSELLSKENVELRALLGNEGSKRIVAGVVGRPNKVPYDVLVLDKGEQDGIVEGAPVFIGDNAVIGIVAKVFSESSVVTLVTTPGFTVSVYIIGPNIYTNAQGIGGGQLRVGVPQGINLEKGNLVILPGVDSGIYGEISVIESTPTQPEQYGYVSPDVPLAGLRLVSVGQLPLQPISFEEAQNIVREIKSEVFKVPVPEGVLVTTDSTTTATTTASTTRKNVP